MCYAVYIGTDHPLPTAAWDEMARKVYLTDLTEKDEPVRAWFSKPHLYYAGSHLRCGCGFFINSMVFTDNPEMMREYETSQQSTRTLIAMLEQALATADTVEVFVTWEGRQAEPPVKRRDMVPQDLLAPLQPYGEGHDAEIQVAVAPVDEQDFIVIRKNPEDRVSV